MADELISGGDKRPLQRRRVRKDGWTDKKKTIFLEHFAATANATASAAEAGMSVTSAYRLRFREPDFRELWNAALEQGYVRLEMMLLERASEERAPTLVEGDKYLSETRKMDTTLALTLLKQKQRRLEEGQRRGRPAGKASLEDLRKEIRKKLSGLNKRLGGEG